MSGTSEMVRFARRWTLQIAGLLTICAVVAGLSYLAFPSAFAAFAAGFALTGTLAFAAPFLAIMGIVALFALAALLAFLNKDKSPTRELSTLILLLTLYGWANSRPLFSSQRSYDIGFRRLRSWCLFPDGCSGLGARWDPCR